jgi:AcrR family transcriptional regulator
MPSPRSTKPRPRGGAARPEATRDALLRAASRLFAEKGYDGTSVDEIAQAASANKAAVSYHFGGKEALYGSVLGSRIVDLATRVRAAIQAGASAEERLRAYVRVFAETVSASPETVPLIVQEMLAGGRRLEAHVLPHFLSVFGVVREILDRGVEEGSLRRVNPLAMHLSVAGGLVFFFLSAPFRTRVAASGRLPVPMPDTREFVAQMQDMVTRGLATPRRSGRSSSGG